MVDKSILSIEKKLKANDPSLTSLSLYFCSYSDLCKILEILKNNNTCRNLTTTHLRFPDFLKDEACLLIAEVIAQNQTLTKINIQGDASKEFGYSVEVFPTIAEKLAHNTKLKQFYWPHLQNESILPFARAIELNPSLQGVTICCTEISQDNINILSEAISKNKNLQSIDFDRTPLDNDGFIQIIKSISVHPKIRRLLFRWCKIGDLGAEAFAKCVQNHKTLLEVDLSCNDITEHGISCIIESIKLNTKIKDVNLRCNKCSNRSIHFVR